MLMTRTAPNSDEDVLVERAKKDHEAFSELYRRYSPRIHNYLSRRVGDAAEAEELTAAVFLRALSRLETYDVKEGSFSTWIFTIAHNALVNWYRDQKRRGTVPGAEPAGPQDVVASILRAEDRNLVQRAVARLPQERQELISLKYVEERSNAEIGRIMGRSEGAVKSLLHRTVRALREEMGRQSNPGQ